MALFIKATPNLSINSASIYCDTVLHSVVWAGKHRLCSSIKKSLLLNMDSSYHIHRNLRIESIMENINYGILQKNSDFMTERGSL